MSEMLSRFMNDPELLRRIDGLRRRRFWCQARLTVYFASRTVRYARFCEGLSRRDPSENTKAEA